ncbi:MAG: LysR family transcriptional regulator [Eubacterium sp.]|jgi:Transcriptional regulator|nr:LysR family transcriptional regulator [Eubacterium sp.]
MNTEQLKYFIAVAKHLNFTNAAKDFYITQPAISHQISELEMELNTKLFQRSTRNVSLTKSGELFLEDAKRILSLQDSTKERIKLIDSSEEMELNIAYLLSPCKIFLPELVHHFHQKYPQVNVRLTRLDAQGIIDSLLQEGCDIYFSLTQDLKMNRNYSCKQIFQDSFCLICRNDHPCLDDTTIDYDKIASEPFLMYTPKNAPLMEKQVIQICHELRFSPRVTQYLPSIEDILFSVECGLGITILPYKTKDCIVNSLAYIPLPNSLKLTSIGVAWKPNNGNQAISWLLNILNQMHVKQRYLF